MWRDAWAVLVKDLGIEARTRVGLWQVLPFAVLTVVLFAFALGPHHGVLKAAAPGLFWLGVLFTALLLIGRSTTIESGEGVGDAQRLLGIDASGVFCGKAMAIAVELLVVEVLLLLGVMALLSYRPSHLWLVAVAAPLATIGLAGVGTLYGAIAGGARVRETLLPMLVLPVLAPVLIAAVKLFALAQSGPVAKATPWLWVLGVFAVVYTAAGIVLYGQVQETS